MANIDLIEVGDEWPEHYRGFSLQISPNRDVWWQLYNGTDRLHLEPMPDDLIDTFLELKPTGGRIHVTEAGNVLTRVDEGDREFNDVYVGEFKPDGELSPPESPEYRIDLRPDGLSKGDLWPSVYDGSRYSFVDQRVWWQNGETKRRHKVEGEFPQDLLQTLQRFKPKGGSFRITPWGDVITLVEMHPAPGDVREQFDELPTVVKNIIRVRKERGVEMLPIYVGSLEDCSISVKEPRTLSDSLSEEEQDALSSWAENLGRTSSTSQDAHQASGADTGNPDDSSNDDARDEDTGAGAARDQERDDDEFHFDDDPVEWARDRIDHSEDRQ